jgi:8-oxo-dGTP pyrophosphatase MutT (NUDIX family)
VEPDVGPAEDEVAGPKFVRAAGGIVWRKQSDTVEVLLVHRPRYDDWSFPKGKIDTSDATDQDAALREVLEETGLRCRIGVELSSTSYADRRGRPKTVRYWAMRPVSGSFAANDEVDEVRWIAVDQAEALLSYPREAHVLSTFQASSSPMIEAG